MLKRSEQLMGVRKRRGVRQTWVSVFAVEACAILPGTDGMVSSNR
ncbi:MAG: hypothetical protein OWS03_12445 [Alicyclobacillaceae bacterium]|nr:hypothetical protein [Alicyclobacillaceae bacterium]